MTIRTLDNTTFYRWPKSSYWYMSALATLPIIWFLGKYIFKIPSTYSTSNISVSARGWALREKRWLLQWRDERRLTALTVRTVRARPASSEWSRRRQIREWGGGERALQGRNLRTRGFQMAESVSRQLKGISYIFWKEAEFWKKLMYVVERLIPQTMQFYHFC